MSNQPTAVSTQIKESGFWASAYIAVRSTARTSAHIAASAESLTEKVHKGVESLPSEDFGEKLKDLFSFDTPA